MMDDKSRIAIIDTVPGDDQLLRYQYSNNLGTAALELDYEADIISYEEYYPYGNTSFQAGRTTTEVSLKRYRYIGKERDEETGLYYMGARYYMPWVGRWIAVDPLESKYSPESPYNYCHNNPIIWNDKTGMGPGDDGLPSTREKSTSQPAPQFGSVQIPGASRVAADKTNYVVPSGSNNATGTGNSLNTAMTRIFGGLKAIGGTVEMAAGATLAVVGSETGVAIIGGGAIAAHGSDVASAGLMQMFTGIEATTLTQKGISKGLQTAGVSKQKAETAAAYTDALISIVGTAGASAVGNTTQLAKATNVVAETSVSSAAKGTVEATAKRVSAEGAVWAQKTFSGTFSTGGKFAGQTVEDVAGALKNGTLSPTDVPINVVVRNEQTFILNTRSSVALIRAGIPRSAWNVVNQSRVSSFENLLTGQLERNGLPTGTNTIRQSGTQLIFSH